MMRCFPPRLAAHRVAKDVRAAIGKMQLDTTKAGLAHVDKAHVNRIIAEATKGSAFFKNEKRMEEERQARIRGLVAKAKEFNALPAAAKRAVMARVAETEADLEACRHFGKYVHVDMDMFYAAVEMKKNPSLASVPLGVGSAAMLSTTNYAARAYGVRSGMPGFIGRRLCPSLVIVPPDFAAYRAAAAAVRAIAAEYDAGFTSVGLDELTMDVAAHLRRRGAQGGAGPTAGGVAAEFRARVHAATGLTASAGIAPTATLAKIASNYDKPNGQHELRLRTREEVVAFMRTLPVRQIPGIGQVQEAQLSAIGIHTCGDLLRRRGLLRYLFADGTFRHYLSAGLGVSQRRTAVPAAHKSVGHEETFRHAARKESELRQRVMESLTVAHQALLKQRRAARRISLRLKRESFRAERHCVTLRAATNDFGALWAATRVMLRRYARDFGDFRLVGVRLEMLTDIRARGLAKSPAVGAVSVQKTKKVEASPLRRIAGKVKRMK